jgi:hypothetical protein
VKVNKYTSKIVVFFWGLSLVSFSNCKNKRMEKAVDNKISKSKAGMDNETENCKIQFNKYIRRP